MTVIRKKGHTYLATPIAIGVDRALEFRTGETGTLSLSLLADGAEVFWKMRAGSGLESAGVDDDVGDKDDPGRCTAAAAAASKSEPASDTTKFCGDGCV